MVVIGNYALRPITVVPHRAKDIPFRRPSILFRPHVPPMKGICGAAGYRPRVRSAYYGRVYVHSSRRSIPNIRARRGAYKRHDTLWPDIDVTGLLPVPWTRR